MIQDRRKILFFRSVYEGAQVPRSLLILSALMALVYLFIIAFAFERGNAVLFYLLVAGEVFHVWQLLTYVHTVWNMKTDPAFDPSFSSAVDIFITVAGEPAEVVEKTVRAAQAMDYPLFEIYILNDGFVAKKDNWREIEALARRLGVHCITRRTPGGAKAGNINNALDYTASSFLAVFDADHAPHQDFLRKTMGYFTDPKMAFVQTPQYYKNRTENYLTAGAWEQQELFFGPILKGKNRSNSAFMCGTNMVLRRKAILEADGMNEKNIAEDFFTSLFVHERGWRSHYVAEVLSEGMSPEDFRSYYNQQFRWARGSLELVFRHNPFFRKGSMTFSQKLEYLASASYYLTGIVVALDAAFPLIFFYTGLVPFKISSMALAAAFLPYMLCVIYTLQRSSNFSYSFRASGLSMGSFVIHLQAVAATILGANSAFKITSKKREDGNHFYLAAPHFLYIVLFIAGVLIGYAREGLSASLVNNVAWGLLNAAFFTPFILAAWPAPKEVKVPEKSLVASVKA